MRPQEPLLLLPLSSMYNSSWKMTAFLTRVCIFFPSSQLTIRFRGCWESFACWRLWRWFRRHSIFTIKVSSKLREDKKDERRREKNGNVCWSCSPVSLCRHRAPATELLAHPLQTWVYVYHLHCSHVELYLESTTRCRCQFVVLSCLMLQFIQRNLLDEIS